VRKSEDFLETFSERLIVRLLRSSIVLQIEVGKNLIARIGLGTELGKKGSEESADALFCYVFEVKIIVTHQG
jgi:hypothetical protein